MTRVGSLFSGAGGLDMAVEAAFGARTVWHCENDRAASKVLAHRWPGVPNLNDITAVDWSDVEPVDILCGGYPCQPFSAAGRRKGSDDERHLWPYFAEAIRALRPRYVVLENVAGHRSMGFNRVLADLTALRYDAQWCSLRASDVGAPHRRERLFVLAADADHTTRCGRHSRSIPARGDWQANRTFERSADVVHAADDTGRIINRDNPPAGPVDLLPTPVVNDMGDGKTVEWWDNWTAAAKAKHGNGNGHGNSLAIEVQRALLPTPNAQDGNGGGRYNSEGHQSTLPGTVRELLPTPCAQQSGNTPENHLSKKPGRTKVTDLAILVENGLLESGGELLPTPRSSDCFGPGVHGDGGMDLRTTVVENATQWGKYEPAIRRWENVTRPAPAPTEPNTKGNPRLAAAFSEWLMGWPEGWVTAVPGVSRNDALRIIGNGVVPQQAIAALQWLLNVSDMVA